MTIWQSEEDNKWYININGNNISFNTKMEALRVMQKQQYIEQVKTIIGTNLGVLADTVPNIHKALFDNGYASGSGNAITDEEAANAGFADASEFYSAFTVIEKVADFLDGNAIDGADYLGTINKVRY